MRALAVDTSTATAGIAVVDEKGLLAEFMLKDMKTHSQKLVPMMKEVLDSLRLTLSDIDVFAAVTGPGSFTGLRIGVTTIRPWHMRWENLSWGYRRWMPWQMRLSHRRALLYVPSWMRGTTRSTLRFTGSRTG